MSFTTDSSTPVRFQAAITSAARTLHLEACNADVDEYESLGHCKRELLRTPSPVSGALTVDMKTLVNATPTSIAPDDIDDD